MPTGEGEGEATIDTAEEPTRGPLMIIGGAEDKLRKRTVLTEFVEAAGGADARIAVIPTASSLGPEATAVYEAVFCKLGAGEVVAAWPQSREDAADPAYVDLLRDATGIFMTGGNQLKLAGVVCGTPFGDAIVAAHRRGVVVAGTSAGASIQSSHMVAFGTGGATPKQRMTQVAAGLGLLESTVIDQHFDQRNRYGRLLMIVSQSPALLGLGIDEDTAAIVTFDGGRERLRVAGKGAVTILDPSRIVTDAHEVPRSKPIMASGVVLHVLTSGARFDLTDRTLVQGEPVPDPAVAAELAEAGSDLRRLTRDIASEGASPSVFRSRIRRARRTAAAIASAAAAAAAAPSEPDSSATPDTTPTETTPTDGASR